MRRPFVLFTDEGERVPKVVHSTLTVSQRSGHVSDDIVRRAYGLRNGYGYVDLRRWRPGYLAISTRGGWRIVNLKSASVHVFVSVDTVKAWMVPVHLNQKRLPSIAAVEMYLRTVRP